jgi:hypothetical protein
MEKPSLLLSSHSNQHVVRQQDIDRHLGSLRKSLEQSLCRERHQEKSTYPAKKTLIPLLFYTTFQKPIPKGYSLPLPPFVG